MVSRPAVLLWKLISPRTPEVSLSPKVQGPVALLQDRKALPWSAPVAGSLSPFGKARPPPEQSQPVPRLLPQVVAPALASGLSSKALPASATSGAVFRVSL
jgi:hypothetical protein